MNMDVRIPTEPVVFGTSWWDLAAHRRQARNAAEYAPQPVASISPEHDHTQPAILGDNFVTVTTSLGSGDLPFFITHPLGKPLPGIMEAYIVDHGVLRDAANYQFHVINALARRLHLSRASTDNLASDYNSSTTLVAASQFPTSVDKPGVGILRWAFGASRAGEPAVEPCPPISSFTAKDALILHIASLLPDLHTLTLYSNSEGGQRDERYLAFSEALKWLEVERSIKIQGLVCNPGSVFYPDTKRPVFSYDAAGVPNIAPNAIRWIDVPYESPENRWPLGMYDPPPYIQRYLMHHTLDEAIDDYARRTTLCVGQLDNNPNGSQLPIGPGLEAQGKTRYERIVGKWAALMHHPRTRNIHTPARLMIVGGTGHNANQMFRIAEAMQLLQSSTPDGT